MAKKELFKKAAIVAMGFVLLRRYAFDGWRTVVWKSIGLLADQPHCLTSAPSPPLLLDLIHPLLNSQLVLS
jgi:hypothetical protein